MVDIVRDSPVRAILVIGTSTGGPRALTEVFRTLKRIPSVACCVVQHMPAGFTANLAKRLNDLSDWIVHEGESGITLQSGHAYIAPGGMQMRVEEYLGGWKLRIGKESPVNGHQPSVDVLFHSVADCASNLACVSGVILTGMGRDGAAGLRHLRNSGAYTIAESADTAVIFGMPKVAIEQGGAADVVPLQEIPDCLEKHFRQTLKHGIGR